MQDSEAKVDTDELASGSAATAPDTAGSAPATETPGEVDDSTPRPGPRKRRRGSRGGRNRKRPAAAAAGRAGTEPTLDEVADDLDDDDLLDDDLLDDDLLDDDEAVDSYEAENLGLTCGADAQRAPDEVTPELPDRISENRPSTQAADKALVRKPQIGDTRPGAAPPTGVRGGGRNEPASNGDARKTGAKVPRDAGSATGGRPEGSEGARKKRRRGGKGRSGGGSGAQRPEVAEAELDADVLERRRGRERNGRPIGRYLMCVQVRPTLTQVAVLEGRTLIEHYVSRPADDVSQIHGNIYVGKVQNVLPGMEAAFVDIGTPKNAVLYRGDVQYAPEDIVEKQPRIEQVLRSKQLIVCQVTKNPIGAKGARLTQEVSMPGRFVVLIPNSNTYGISKRLPDDVRKRLRNILDRLKPAEHGLIVRTAAEHATEHELRADMARLLDEWAAIEAKAKKAQGPTLLYREPELAVRVIREEFNSDYRGVVIDDQRLFDDVHGYVAAFNPELADRVEFYDAVEDGLPVYERFHIHEQLHKALDSKVWLPSGGSLIIQHTEALTVIDVNTGKNVGTSNLEETVFRNNLEAAEEVAKQLRLRDIGGIVVIDFIDMEIRENRRRVVDAFRSALARDKTRTQVFEIGELGLLEMTRKRIGEGLLVSFADQCPDCAGRGVVIDHALLA
ncbi:MAG: Rne/Rng family ribonuclease [Actinobacteria bacterium]|nr:Rne/Rng family ribonuclease [Actinomycetota bacterium]